MDKKNILNLAVILLAASHYQATAADWTDKVRLNGFANALYQVTNEEVPIHGPADEGGIDDKGSFQGTGMGFNITANINDDLTLYSQISATHEDRYAMHLDWGFMGLELSESFTLRAGNIKFPVGLVNEYVDVGALYPWMKAPQVIYSETVPNGAQAIRDGYSGASILYSESFDDWTLGADLFGGEVKMDEVDVRETRGITVRADWNDEVLIQASTYNGLMQSDSLDFVVMDGQKHDVTTMGIKADINDIIFYAEHANVKMGNIEAMKAKTWYATLGYRMNKWLLFYTYEDFDKGTDASASATGTDTRQLQNFSTLGLNYALLPNTVVKAEIATINTDKGKGMFQTAPTQDSVNRYGLGLSVVF